MNVDGGIDPSSSSIKCLWPFNFIFIFLTKKFVRDKQQQQQQQQQRLAKEEEGKVFTKGETFPIRP